MSIYAEKYQKAISMDLTRKLDIVNSDIKRIEEFLSQQPIYFEYKYSYSEEKGSVLTWSIEFKRVFYSDFSDVYSSPRPILEMDVEKRQEIHGEMGKFISALHEELLKKESKYNVAENSLIIDKALKSMGGK